MYCQYTGKIVERFHKSLIKEFLVSTSSVEYENTRTMNLYVIPIDVWRCVWTAAEIHRWMTEDCFALRTLQYST